MSSISCDFPYSARLSKEAINALPLWYYEGDVVMVKKEAQLQEALERLSQEAVIGVDTETRPSFRKGRAYKPSLIQIAGKDTVFLFHLEWGGFVQELSPLFEDSTIVKAGVALTEDLKALQQYTCFTPQSFCDLSLAAKHTNVAMHGLRGLAALFLGKRISKGERCSNWGNKDLTPKQVRYAATDAWVSRELYVAMQREGLLGADM